MCYYTQNPYQWESLQDPDNHLQNIADRLLESFYYDLYADRIESDFSWLEIQEECNDNTESDPDNPGEWVGRSYLGTVFEIMPSGKYWTVWASGNVDRIEQIQDSAYMEALESVADNYGLWIESGDGDPCDLYAGMRIDPEESDSMSLIEDDLFIGIDDPIDWRYYDYE